MGGKWAGKDIVLNRTAQGYEGTLSKYLKINLIQEDDRFTGRMGHDVLGTSWDMKWEDSKLSGRFGGAVMGYDASAESVDTDPLITAVITCLSYYWYSETAPKSKAKF